MGKQYPFVFSHDFVLCPFLLLFARFLLTLVGIRIKIITTGQKKQKSGRKKERQNGERRTENKTQEMKSGKRNTGNKKTGNKNSGKQ